MSEIDMLEVERWFERAFVDCVRSLLRRLEGVRVGVRALEEGRCGVGAEYEREVEGR